jgi:pumilio RNA-binding family
MVPQGHFATDAGHCIGFPSNAPAEMRRVLVPVMQGQPQGQHFVAAVPADCSAVSHHLGNMSHHHQQIQFVSMVPYQNNPALAVHQPSLQAIPFAPAGVQTTVSSMDAAGFYGGTTEDRVDTHLMTASWSARSTGGSSQHSLAIDATPSHISSGADLDACPTPVKIAEALSVCSSESTKGSETRRSRRRRGGKAKAASASHQEFRRTTGKNQDSDRPPLPPGHLVAGENNTPAQRQHDNYHASSVDAEWCKNLLKDLERDVPEDEAAQAAAIAQVRGQVVRLAFDAAGCRVVQKALEVAGKTERETMVGELHGHAVEAMRSPHANFVIQKVVELMPASTAGFIAEELAVLGCDAARHRYGCRLLCRILEHHSLQGDSCGRPLSSQHSLKQLLDEVVGNAATLVHHAFAHHVMDSIVEHGTADMRHFVAMAIRSNLVQNAKNRYASYVVERSMTYCSSLDQHAYVNGFLADIDELFVLANHEYGSHVVRTVMQLPCPEGGTEQVKSILRAGAARLKESKYGRRVLDGL